MRGFRNRTTGFRTGMVKRGVGECRARAYQCNGASDGDPYRRLGYFLNHRTPHVRWRLSSSGSLAIFAAIRRAAFFRRSRVFVDWSVPQADINFSASVRRTTFILIKLHVIRPQGAWSHQDRGSHDLVLAHRSMPQACLMSKFMRPDAACHTTL